MKTRALFKWICNNIKYDVAAFTSGKRTDVSAPTVLKSRKSVCEGYANLFYALAKECNLEVGTPTQLDICCIMYGGALVHIMISETVIAFFFTK